MRQESLVLEGEASIEGSELTHHWPACLPDLPNTPLPSTPSSGYITGPVERVRCGGLPGFEAFHMLGFHDQRVLLSATWHPAP